MLVFIDDFGKDFSEDEILLYTFKSGGGMEVSITNFGAIITSIKVPDNKGNIDEITMGFDNLQQYIDNHPYFGALVGRYANRIGNGSFTLDGTTYNLFRNNGANHLHGGQKGFDKKLWNSILENDSNGATLKLFYLSRDMEEGYPGNLLTNVTYRIFDNNSLEIHFQATTDKITHVNLTSHCYFNLNGFKRNVLDHILFIDANHYLPLTDDMIPTGEIAGLSGTAYDFSKPKKIGEDISKIPNGYDNCYVLNSPSLHKPSAIVEDLVSGRFLKIFTTQPGIQLYTGNFLDGSSIGHNKTSYRKHFGLCLETQHFPDTPNKPGFPSTLLKPNEEYNHSVKYEFGIK